MKRIAVALALAASLSGCGIFRGGEKPKAAVLGERIPVLTAESGAEVDPASADLGVTLPPSQVNTEWAQPGGNAAKSMGQLALGAQPAQAWQAVIAGGSPRERLAATPVIAENKLFVIDVTAAVHAYAADTGTELWTVELSPGKKNSGSRFGGGAS